MMVSLVLFRRSAQGAAPYLELLSLQGFQAGSHHSTSIQILGCPFRCQSFTNTLLHIARVGNQALLNISWTITLFITLLKSITRRFHFCLPSPLNYELQTFSLPFYYHFHFPFNILGNLYGFSHQRGADLQRRQSMNCDVM